MWLRIIFFLLGPVILLGIIAIIGAGLAGKEERPAWSQPSKMKRPPKSKDKR